ncbi:hypothetical protein H257_10146 [Aphanomyces astaci]|uniref:Uncharacterized protein n=1 Tax=Aphanomyces astaci TaxID=112090 RepID=W4G7X8_APHAT|nr:hypothetical protein H257_10146 [Aphanomyces astaci]ETV75775.1 hypothetical protein H257_10146 [Aphanomyces astaci]|eukprot:XP_009834906.1 hypothetical protein H257_10146 [Aphanomyces astaci]
MTTKEISPRSEELHVRKAIQEITDLLIHRNDQIELLIEGSLNRKIQVYHKARKIKAEARVDRTVETLTRTQAAQMEASERMASQHMERATR